MKAPKTVPASSTSKINNNGTTTTTGIAASVLVLAGTQQQQQQQAGRSERLSAQKRNLAGAGGSTKNGCKHRKRECPAHRSHTNTIKSTMQH